MSLGGIAPIEDFLDMMPDTVTIYAFQSQTVAGLPTYATTGTPYRCHIRMKNHMIVDAAGREILARGRIVLGTRNVISVKDKIVLPSEYVPVSPPILAVNVATDESGNHHTTVEIG